MSEPLSDQALDQLFRTARTYNGYADKPVADAQLHAIWELVKYGPTSAAINAMMKAIAKPSSVVCTVSPLEPPRRAGRARPNPAPELPRI